VQDPVQSNIGRRARKALATRNRVLDAAEARFVRDGYAATTIAAIAEQADVAVQTIYAVFGTKRAVLNELLAVRVAGDDDTIPNQAPARVQTRPEWRALEREPDARRQLALLAEFATNMGSRISGLYQVLAGAAGSDPEIAELYRNQQQARYKDQLRLARTLARAGALRQGLSETTAADIMWTLANPHTHHALIAERRWTPIHYQQWLSDTLAHALLSEPRSGPGRTPTNLRK
jgi:AcrR family transcriptional regulator